MVGAFLAIALGFACALKFELCCRSKGQSAIAVIMADIYVAGEERRKRSAEKRNSQQLSSIVIEKEVAVAVRQFLYCNCARTGSQ